MKTLRKIGKILAIGAIGALTMGAVSAGSLTTQCDNIFGQDSMVAYWQFNDLSDSYGSFPLESLQDNAKVGIAPGKLGTALSLDGINDGAKVSGNEALYPGTNSFTWAAWVKSTQTRGLQDIISIFECGTSCDNYPVSTAFFSIMDGKARMYIKDSGRWNEDQMFSSSLTIADGNWHFVVFVRDLTNNNGRLYVDGNLEVSETLTAGATGNIYNEDGSPDSVHLGVTRTFGNSGDVWIQEFRGSIDEVAIFKKALSDSDILKMYQRSSTYNQNYCTILDADGDGYPSSIDCNDTNAAIHPGALEVCDGVDNNCINSIDENIAPIADDNVEGLCVNNIKICTGGSMQPSLDNYQPVAESCDGLDNDCANGVDNGMNPIVTGTDVGECQVGIKTCQGTAGYVVTQQQIDPQSFDTPGNNLDEDCNSVSVCNSADVWQNHGAFVSCVSKSSEGLLNLGLITQAQKDLIVSSAAQSEVGKLVKGKK